MKTALSVFVLATLASSPLLAQTKTPAKPATTTTKPATKPTTTTTTKPAAKPAATSTTKPAAKPAAKTTTVVRKPAAKPAPKATTTRPAPATASPAPQPAPTTTPQTPANAPATAKTTNKLGWPGGATSFAKGTVAVNLGVGIGGGYGYGLGFGGSVKSAPAISLSVEKGIIDGVGPGVISVGGLIGYKRFTYGWNFLGDKYEASWNNIIVVARGAYHYNFTEDPKLDTYAGLSLGARIENYSDNFNGSTSGSYGGAYLTSGIFLGGRYYFSDNIGGFAELGYDVSYLKLGLTAKF